MLWVWITSGSISAIIFIATLLIVIAVLVVFCRKRRPGGVSKKLMKVSDKKAKEIRKIIKKNRPWFENTQHQKMYIKSYDNLKLSGMYYPAEKESLNTIICIHGYCGRYYSDFAQLAPFYHSEGYNLLLINDRGHGDSEGAFIGFSIKDQYDLYEWIKKIDKKFDSKGKIFLHGVSMGSATSLLVSGMDLPDSVKGIISDCGFTSPEDQAEHLLTKYELPYPILYTIEWFTKIITGNNFNKANGIKAVSHSKTPILFIHGDKDPFVPSWMAKKAYKACSSEKYLEIFKNAGHAASQYFDFNRFKAITKNFLRKYTTNSN